MKSDTHVWIATCIQTDTCVYKPTVILKMTHTDVQTVFQRDTHVQCGTYGWFDVCSNKHKYAIWHISKMHICNLTCACNLTHAVWHVLIDMYTLILFNFAHMQSETWSNWHDCAIWHIWNWDACSRWHICANCYWYVCSYWYVRASWCVQTVYICSNWHTCSDAHVCSDVCAINHTINLQPLYLYEVTCMCKLTHQCVSKLAHTCMCKLT